MKHLRTFENFSHNDMGRFSDTDADEQEWIDHLKSEEESEEEFPNELEEESEEDEELENTPIRRKVWGDEVVEKKKINPGFKAYLDKKKEKGSKKDDKKSDKKEDEKSDKGLTAAQKKLPKALQKSILDKKKK